MCRDGKTWEKWNRRNFRCNTFVKIYNQRKQSCSLWLSWMARSHFKYNYEWWYTQICPRDIKSFEYNNIESLKNIFKNNKLAAVILEPLSYEIPKNKFLEKVKNLCKKNNTILIFDEICTGFRVSLGGAQKLYSVTPDLATFGKGMANGFPISALVGKAKYMKHVEKIFYSGTFGGEILSIKACIETIKFFKKIM